VIRNLKGVKVEKFFMLLNIFRHMGKNLRVIILTPLELGLKEIVSMMKVRVKQK